MADNPSPDSSMYADYPQIRAAVRGIESAGGSLGAVTSVGSGYIVDGMWSSAMGTASLGADNSLSEYSALLSDRLRRFAGAAMATVDELVLTDGEFAALVEATLPR